MELYFVILYENIFPGIDNHKYTKENVPSISAPAQISFLWNKEHLAGGLGAVWAIRRCQSLMSAFIVTLMSQDTWSTSAVSRSKTVSWSLDTLRVTRIGTGLMVNAYHKDLFDCKVFVLFRSPWGWHARGVHTRVRQQRGHLVQSQDDLLCGGRDTARHLHWRQQGRLVRACLHRQTIIHLRSSDVNANMTKVNLMLNIFLFYTSLMKKTYKDFRNTFRRTRTHTF